MEHKQDVHDNDKKPSRKLVRILIIVGIGVPILVELLTLFNLLNVRFFETEDISDQQIEEKVNVPIFSEGDTLIAKHMEAVLLKNIKINVNARQWKFELTLAKADTSGQYISSLSVDSLRLKSGEVLQTADSREWKSSMQNLNYLEMEWDLPSGDMPYTIYLSYQQKVAEDSVTKGSREIRLGNIPVRYNRKEE